MKPSKEVLRAARNASSDAASIRTTAHDTLRSADPQALVRSLKRLDVWSQFVFFLSVTIGFAVIAAYVMLTGNIGKSPDPFWGTLWLAVFAVVGPLLSVWALERRAQLITRALLHCDKEATFRACLLGLPRTIEPHPSQRLFIRKAGEVLQRIIDHSDFPEPLIDDEEANAQALNLLELIVRRRALAHYQLAPLATRLASIVRLDLQDGATEKLTQLTSQKPRDRAEADVHRAMTARLALSPGPLQKPAIH